MVPAKWQHPTMWGTDYKTGKPRLQFKPLFGGSWSEDASEWDEENAQWERGYEKDSIINSQWKPKETDRHETFEEWSGPRPKQEDYMPEWGPGEAPYLMMYEDTSEGTPLSPAFSTPEELARWLADRGTSSFADNTATYEQWLFVCRGGFAPSAVLDANGLRSGVEAMADLAAAAENSPKEGSPP
jgi:hypothetical protein